MLLGEKGVEGAVPAGGGFVDVRNCSGNGRDSFLRVVLYTGNVRPEVMRCLTRAVGIQSDDTKPPAARRARRG